MKKLLLVSLLSLGLSATAFAAEDRSRAAVETNRLAHVLDVNESQLPAFQAVVNEFAEKRRTLGQEYKNSIDALNAEQRESLSGVLTPEQLEKFDAVQQRGKKNWRNDKRPFSDRGPRDKHGAVAE